ncbi:MAG: Hsp20/alpha crystallin family protein [Chitinophagaceae bacterium]|nr:Hsp20/alpha crystallin family protein [Chitinophagaceae bacterium]
MTQLKFINRPVAKFDNFFSDFFSPSVWANPSADVTGTPAANVHETPSAYILEISAPGRNKEDFKVNLDQDLLTVSYEKNEEKKTEDEKTIRREFHHTSFKRSFSLDEKVDAANIQAKYENGILKIELPKKPEVQQQPKQIAIS